MKQPLTTQPIARVIVRLSAPIFLSMVINSLWLSADIFFLGKLSPAYIAVATYLSPCLFVVYAVLEGVSVPLIVLIGRAVGTENPHDFTRVRDTGWTLLCGLSLVVSLCGMVLLPVVSRVFTVDPLVSTPLRIYALCFVASVIPWCLRTYQSALCGGAGHTLPSYVGSLTFVGAKVLLQGVLLWSGALSMVGIGCSTVIAMWLSVGCTALYMRRLTIRGKPTRWMAVSPDMARQFLVMALPVVAGNLLGAFESGMTLGFFDGFGTDVVAALGLLERVRTMALFPAIAIGMGISIFVSHHLGAGQMARAWHGVSGTFRLIICAYVGIAIVCYVGIAPVLALLAPDAPMARAFATIVAKTELIGFPCLALSFIGQGAFEGMGKTYPNLVTLIIVVLFGRLLPYVLIVPEIGPMALRYILPWSHLLHAVEAVWCIVAIRRLGNPHKTRQPAVAVAGYAL